MTAFFFSSSLLLSFSDEGKASSGFALYHWLPGCSWKWQRSRAHWSSFEAFASSPFVPPVFGMSFNLTCAPYPALDGRSPSLLNRHPANCKSVPFCSFSSCRSSFSSSFASSSLLCRFSVTRVFQFSEARHQIASAGHGAWVCSSRSFLPVCLAENLALLTCTRRESRRFFCFSSAEQCTDGRCFFDARFFALWRSVSQV